MKKISIILCLLWMGFIFYMSGNNGEISHEQSNKVVDIIESTQFKLQIASENRTTSQIKQESKENNIDYIIRKNAHAFMYMTLSFLVSSTFFVYKKGGKDSIVYIMFICILYAVTDEFHQSFVPGRTSLVSDILVDFAGALIGLTIFYTIYYKIYKRSNLKIFKRIN